MPHFLIFTRNHFFCSHTGEELNLVQSILGCIQSVGGHVFFPFNVCYLFERKVQWNPVNTTTVRPKYFGRNNGVVVLTGVGIKLQLTCFLMTSQIIKHLKGHFIL